MDFKKVIHLDTQRKKLKVRWKPFKDKGWNPPYQAYPTYIEMLNLVLGFFIGLSLGIAIGGTVGLLIGGGYFG